MHTVISLSHRDALSCCGSRTPITGLEPLMLMPKHQAIAAAAAVAAARSVGRCCSRLAVADMTRAQSYFRASAHLVGGTLTHFAQSRCAPNISAFQSRFVFLLPTIHNNCFNLFITQFYPLFYAPGTYILVCSADLGLV